MFKPAKHCEKSQGFRLQAHWLVAVGVGLIYFTPISSALSQAIPNEKEEEMVYRLFYDSQEKYSYDVKYLDGDFDKVLTVDLTPDEGRTIRSFNMYAGRAIDGSHLPRKVMLEGPKRKITDYYSAGAFLVDAKFKTVVDELEPDTHQFFPVELVWKDSSLAGERYWFFPCNRLDTVDCEKTTKKKRNLWSQRGDGEIIFNKSKIGTHHIWIDKFMTSDIGVLVSDEMHDALVAAGVTGMGFNAFQNSE